MFFLYIDPGTGYVIAGLGGWILAILVGGLGLFSLFFKKISSFFKKNIKLILILIVLTILIGIIIKGAITMNNKTFQFDKKLVILGFDGLSPEIIEPMMKEGLLPNFSRLKDKGSYSRLATTNPSQSPVAWSGFATGQNPGKNGVFDFIIRDPENYGLSLSLSNIEKGKAKRVIKSKCFWQYTSEKRIPSVILTCPITFPPDKIHGKMLSGMGVPDILGTEGTFTFYTSEAIDSSKDIGGKVFNVKKTSLMVMNLIGPKVAQPGGKVDHVKVLFKAKREKGSDHITISYQDNEFKLKEGQWSEFKEVTFKLGLFKKMKGILKFYLVQNEPEFKLYISPINYDPRKPYFQISHPQGYSRELASDLGLYYTLGMPMDTWAVNEKRLTEKPFLEQANMILDERKKMLDLELSRMDRGVLFSYFGSSDIIQHMFWRYTDTAHPLYEKDAPAEYKNMIKTWYKKVDDILGKTLDKLGPDDVVIVLSDHGFNTFRRSAHLNSWLRKNGYLKLKDPSAASGAELLSDIDWDSTKAYAIGFGAIYLNQRGREAGGIVEPGEETESLKKEIKKKLLEWRDEKYGAKVVNSIYEREEIFWGDYASITPDLYTGFNTGYRASWQTALGAVPENLMEDNLKKWSGSHLFDPGLIPGVLFSNQKVTKQDPSIYDIAPTVMKLTGFGGDELKKSDLDGTPLF